MPSPFELPFFQDGVIVVLLLAIASGLLGTWVVLRGLAFFAHAAGTATFPGLVLADGLGFAAVLGAFGSALAVTGLIAVAGSRREDSRNSVTAIVLAASLAVGAILASDVFGSQASVDRLLFGSLLAIDAGDQALAALAAAGAVAGVLLLGPRWLATGFEGEVASRGRRTDAVLVALVALAAVAALSAVGALLATTLIVVPAATARLVTSSDVVVAGGERRARRGRGGRRAVAQLRTQRAARCGDRGAGRSRLRSDGDRARGGTASRAGGRRADDRRSRADRFRVWLEFGRSSRRRARQGRGDDDAARRPGA